MCGIFCEILHITNKNISKSPLCLDKDLQLLELLKCRGPDASGNLTIYINDHDEISEEENCSNATSLHDKKTLIKMSGHTLWMQGTAPDIQPLNSKYGSLLFNGDLFNTAWVKDDSDTRALFAKLEYKLNNTEIDKHIIDLLKTLNGPFSFLYYEKVNRRLYFCRDRIGRRSLLVHHKNDSIIISSLLSIKYYTAIELPADKIFRYSFTTNTISEYYWNSEYSNTEEITVDEWIERLNQSSSIVNYVESTVTEQDDYLLKLLETVTNNYKNPQDFFLEILKNENMSQTVDQLLKFLSNSVKFRVMTQPKYCSLCVKTMIKCTNHCTVGVLFSGGLDCTILAALIHQFIPIEESIDLLNVAFETVNGSYDTPDRITSQQSLNELQQLYPERIWNLVKINVTREELQESQIKIIADLMFPLQSVLDESIGSALWFAARGKTLDFTSTCRILITGIGADELFGGYTRHRNVFKRQGWAGLERELQFDWHRISSRNLARDDRIVSYHGRQPRMPYLDEEFVKFSINLKPWFRCFFNAGSIPGTGDKMALRLAAFRIGLKKTSAFPKRAIQFGSRIANKKENAADKCQTIINLMKNMHSE